MDSGFYIGDPEIYNPREVIPRLINCFLAGQTIVISVTDKDNPKNYVIAFNLNGVLKHFSVNKIKAEHLPIYNKLKPIIESVIEIYKPIADSRSLMEYMRDNYLGEFNFKECRKDFFRI